MVGHSCCVNRRAVDLDQYNLFSFFDLIHVHLSTRIAYDVDQTDGDGNNEAPGELSWRRPRRWNDPG